MIKKILSIVISILVLGCSPSPKYKPKQIDSSYNNYNSNIEYTTISDEELLAILVNYYIEKEFIDARAITLIPKSYILRGDEERFEHYKKREKKINKKRNRQINIYNKKLNKQKKNIITIAQRSVHKAFGIVYGRPYFQDFFYDSDKEILNINVLGTKRSFNEKVVFNIKAKNYANISENIQYIMPKVILEYANHIIDLKRVMFIYKGKKYFGRFSEKKFTPKNAKIVIDFSKYKKLKY